MEVIVGLEAITKPCEAFGYLPLCKRTEWNPENERCDILATTVADGII